MVVSKVHMLLWCCFAILKLKKKGSTIYYGLTLTTLIGYKLLYKCSFHQQIGNYLLFSISEELSQVSLNQAILVIDLGVGSYPAWELVQGIGEGKPEKRKETKQSWKQSSRTINKAHLPRCYTRSPTATVRDRFCWNQASPAALGDQHENCCLMYTVPLNHHKPLITENNGSVVHPVSYYPPHGLVHSTRCLLLVPLLSTQTLPKHTSGLRTLYYTNN